jgi:protein with PEP-CTERM/exosortase system signal
LFLKLAHNRDLHAHGVNTGMRVLFESTNHKTMKKQLFTVVCTATACLFATGSPAQAGYIVTLTRQGSNVVASGSGAIDLTGLTFSGSASDNPGSGLFPSKAVIATGAGVPSFDGYTGLSGPTSFGNGAGTLADSGSGDVVGIDGSTGGLGVPHGYMSGAALSDSAIYHNATFSSLGVAPGTYEWTWGTGPNQNFTLQVGTVTVPESGSTLGLLLIAVSGLFGLNRFRSSVSA